MARKQDQLKAWYELLRRYGLQAEFDLAVTRYQEEHPGVEWKVAFEAVKSGFTLPSDDGSGDVSGDGSGGADSDGIDRTTGKRTYLQDAEWAYQNLDRAESMGMDEAPSAGAWSLLQRAHRDPSVLDSPMMLLAKRQQADEEERAVQKDCRKSVVELRAILQKLRDAPFE